MPETLEQMRRNLDVFEDEERKLREAVDRLRDLLHKADQKRRETFGTDEQRKWNAKLDELEDSLTKAKSSLTRCERDVLEYRLKIAEAEHAEITSEDTTHIVESFAAETNRVLSGATEPGKEFSLQDAALARSALLSNKVAPGESVRKHVENQIEQFAAKPKVRSSPIGPQPRSQLLLREALEKCASDRVGELTFAEMDLVATCFDLISRRASPGDTDDRMMEILSRAIVQISERCSVIIRLRRQIGDPDGERT